MSGVQQRKMSRSIGSLLALAAVIMAVVALSTGTTPAGAQATPLPSTSGGDAAVRSCVDELNSAPTDATGKLEGKVPAPCETAIEPSPNLVAQTNVLAPGDVLTEPFNPFVFGGNCGSYVPPSVTVVPTNPVPNGPFTATGINWPPNSSIFGYSIAFNSAGVPQGIYGLVFVNTNAAGQFVIGGTVDSRPVAYYEMHFVSLQCPGTQVTLQVTMGTGDTGTTTTGPSTTGGATTTSAPSTSVPEPTVLGETSTPSTSIGPNSSGPAVLDTSQSRSGSPSPASAGLATTGGPQNVLAWFALLLGAAGWILLQVSRRREADPVIAE